MAENLRAFNKALDDSTFIYAAGPEDDKEVFENAMNLIKFETKNPILVVKNSELQKQLKMEPGKFYCYYKPSYINGFG